MHLAQDAVDRRVGHCKLDGSRVTLLAEATLKYKAPVTIDAIQNIPFNETPGWYLPGGKDHWFAIQLPHPEHYGTMYTTRMPRMLDHEAVTGAGDYTDMNLFRRRCQAISTVVVLVDKLEMKNVGSSQLLEYYRSNLQLNVIHHPIKDFAIIPAEEIDSLTDRMLDVMQSGNCLVHCMGGSGRTGMVVVEVLKKLCVPDPIHYCRSIKSVYLDTEAQVRFVESLPSPISEKPQ